MVNVSQDAYVPDVLRVGLQCDQARGGNGGHVDDSLLARCLVKPEPSVAVKFPLCLSPSAVKTIRVKRGLHVTFSMSKNYGLVSSMPRVQDMTPSIESEKVVNVVDMT